MVHQVRCCLSLLVLHLCFVQFATASAQENWPRFRGADGLGVSSQSGVPVTWDSSQPTWKVQLPNIGHSSPVIWGKHLFVTSATDGGSERFIHCCDADSGALLWSAAFKMEASRKHQKNSWASSTPATDGRIVCCLFADASRLVAKAWDFSGSDVWSVDLGSYESEHNLGVSAIIED
ncbi:MAG: PQQ-binding-like beta-propeller repeat protein, partial [Planctomyces sp.]